MAKMLLWICIGVGGTVFGAIPLLFGSQDVFWSVILSTIGGIIGIWVWYKWLRYS